MLSKLAVLLILALAPFSVLVADDAQRPISHEDLWLMPRVGAPVISPDGRHAVVRVIRPAYDTDEEASHLWLVATDGEDPPRQLTFQRGAESDASWSADSNRIAFTAQRGDDEAAQVYVLDLAQGGEARRVTSVSTGARHPLFSPDGERIAFTTDVPPGSRSDEDSRRLSEEEAEQKHAVHVYTGFPIRNWDRWLTNRQPRLLVQRLDDEEATDLLADSALVEMPGYDAPGGSFNAAWAPDGESLVFVASRNRHRAAFDFTHADLWQVPAAGGEPRRLTGAEGLQGDDHWSSPVFGPGGRDLFVLRQPRTDRVYNANRLVRLSWPDAAPQAEITLPEARSVLDFSVSPDGRDVFMLTDDAGHVKLYRAASRGGDARLAFDMDQGFYSNLSMSRSARRAVLVANFESATSPAEVVRIDLRRGGHTPLTRFTADQVAGLDLAPVEHFWFENDAGMRIHSLLVKPAGFDPERRYPLLVFMHGGPHMMSRDNAHLRWNYHLMAGTEYVLVATNFRGSTGFGEAFAQSIQGDPLRGPANDINQAAAEAVARFDFIDGERQCAAGASYGGHLANWMLSATDQYRCLISHAGLVSLAGQWGTSDVVYHREVNLGSPPWEGDPTWLEQSPIQYAAQWRTPMLVTAGARDFRVPLNNTLELWTALQRQQVESRLLVYPEENHWILSGHNSRHFYGEVAGWLARWLLEEDEP